MTSIVALINVRRQCIAEPTTSEVKRLLSIQARKTTFIVFREEKDPNIASSHRIDVRSNDF